MKQLDKERRKKEKKSSATSSSSYDDTYNRGGNDTIKRLTDTDSKVKKENSSTTDISNKIQIRTDDFVVRLLLYNFTMFSFQISL
jgi:hypothetical protein